MLKLYFFPASCSLAPHIALQESGLPYETLAVDLRAKTFSGGDFKKINPKGSVPALQLANGDVLTECAVILQYIADQAPKANLLPANGTWERYRSQEWLNYIATELHKGFSPLWNPATPEEYKVIAINNLEQRFDYLNSHLAKNNFVMGAEYTVVDAYLFTVVNWSRFKEISLSPWANLQTFMTRIQERPATLTVLKAEGLTT